MELMESHIWFDSDVERVMAGIDEGRIEICFKKEVEAILVSRNDAIALAKEFGLVVYEKDSNL